MITFDTFKKSIMDIDAQLAKETELYDMGIDITNFSLPTTDDLILLLDEAFCPQDQWISWWICETNCGADRNMTTVKVGAIGYDLVSIEDLWEFVHQDFIK